MILRTLANIIENNLFTGKAIIVLGARQVGKTTMFRQFAEVFPGPILNWDNIETRGILNVKKIDKINTVVVSADRFLSAF